MGSVFYVRHQAAGVLHEFPFMERPTDAQVDALREFCESRHGDNHAKTEKPFWLMVVEVPLLGPDDVPQLAPAEPPGAASGAASTGVDAVGVDATGNVSNP